MVKFPYKKVFFWKGIILYTYISIRLVKEGEIYIEIVQRLSHIHAKYGVYSENQIKGDVSESLLEDIISIADLTYLTNFYDSYFKEYQNSIDGNWYTNSFNGDNVARSTDLPFIGSDVVDRGTAEYLFVFKGSLQSVEKLSMTVLSCFWIFNSTIKYQNLFHKYWPSQNYDLLLKILVLHLKLLKNHM